MADVFVSYAREDYDAVLELARELRRHGLSVFVDQDTRVGRDFPSEIEKRLRQASCVIVLWSRASVESRWVRAEAEIGAERGVLVPLRIEEVAPPIPFAAIETADLIGWPSLPKKRGVRRVLRAVLQLVNQSSTDSQTLSPDDDPSLSQRVASRVLRSLRSESHAEHSVARLEHIFAVSLLDMLRGGITDSILGSLLGDISLAIKARAAQYQSPTCSLSVGRCLTDDFDIQTQSEGTLHFFSADEDSTGIDRWRLVITGSFSNRVVFVGRDEPGTKEVEALGFLVDLVDVVHRQQRKDGE
jgi:hypothetical protein